MIEIPEFPELSFREEDHRYFLNGAEIPSVTSLMKPLSNEFYKEVSPEILNKAANRGTIVHNACENYALYGVEDICPEYAGYFAAFLNWWNENNPSPLATEVKVYHRILRYAGKADLLCLINGRVTLVDYKTSSQVNKMLCGVQLEGYDRAFESHGIKIEDRLILHLCRNGLYSAVPFEKSSKRWSVFSALLTIRNYMNEF